MGTPVDASHVTTFGSDRHGELYVGTLEGEIWRLETAPAQ